MTTIRKMNFNDYDSVDVLMQELHLLHLNARSDLYAAIDHPYTKEDFLTKLSDSNCIPILAEIDNSIVGISFVTIRFKSNMVDKCIAYMDDLYVAKSFRHQGIATMLFQEAKMQAKNLGAERLDLMVWSFNHDAISFYKSLGMTEQRYILEQTL